jgi:hypothetical protein
VAGAKLAAALPFKAWRAAFPASMVDVAPASGWADATSLGAFADNLSLRPATMRQSGRSVAARRFRFSTREESGLASDVSEAPAVSIL